MGRGEGRADGAEAVEVEQEKRHERSISRSIKRGVKSIAQSRHCVRCVIAPCRFRPFVTGGSQWQLLTRR
jgi:hypothetical protein